MLDRRLALLTASAALVLVGCSPAPSGSPATSAPQTTPPNLDRFYHQQIQWGSCDGYRHPEDALPPGLECAKIDVPLDYSKPTGEVAHIAMSRVRAAGERTGSVIVNPGGPGASGLGTAAMVARSAVGRSFDVIGFDPRGVGASTPAVLCDSPADVEEGRKQNDVDFSPKGIATTEGEEKEYVDRCSSKTPKALLENIGTADVVKDIDVMRAVLGDDKLTFVGYSYGTKIGTDYLAAYPDKVRAMVLDGAVRPGSDPVEEIRVQLAGFQTAFDNYAKQCAQQADCPLGDDPTQAVKRYRELVDPLIATSAPTADPRGLSYKDAITGTQQALYGSRLWNTLSLALNQLKSGRGDGLLALADMYEGRREDGSYSNMEDAFTAVRCVDDARVTDRAEAGKADAEYRAAAPFLDDGGATGRAPLDICAFWPVKADPEPNIPAGLPKVVVVSTTGDPATPYDDGVALAKAIGASLVTYDGTQHTVTFNSGVACIDDAASAYLVDLVLPPDGLAC